MSVITRSAHPDLLWPGVMGIYGQGYNPYPPQWSQVFEKRTSSKAYEKIVETSGFGLAPIKTEGAPIQYDTDAQGIVTTLTPIAYGLGWMATEEEIEDGQYPEVSKRRAKALGKSMRTTAEFVHWNLFNRGFSGSYLGTDGVALFSTAHPSPAGNRSNTLSVAADLTEASLEDMQTLMAASLDRRGLPVKLNGMKLVVASGAEFNAKRILNSTLRAGTANNDANVHRGELEIVVSNYLTDLDAWFITTDVDEGLLSIWRREPEQQQDSDFDTGNARAKATMRFSTGYGDFLSVFGSPGA